MDKNFIRNEILTVRNNITAEEVSEKSKEIYEIFINSEDYKKSQIIMSYISFKNEVDTFEIMKKIIEDKKILIVPKTTKDFNILPIKINDFSGLKSGRYGIMEPISDKIYEDNIDLVLVPGVAFDKNKNRVGFGKGYYDRFLRNYKEIIKIGLSYDFQMVEEIDTNKYDIKMDKIITNKGVY